MMWIDGTRRKGVFFLLIFLFLPNRLLDAVTGEGVVGRSRR